jgi:hypothetical protein
MVVKIPVARFAWHPAFRIVPTRYPSVYLFDRVADPADFDALYALEAMTNDRVREETGQIEVVAKADRVFGPGSGPIMAAFTHVNPLGSRFSDGSFGVFYAASRRDTAIAETRHHHARFLRATAEPAMHLPMRLYRVEIDAELHDLRRHKDAAVFDPDSYAASRALGAKLAKAGSMGVGFRSVRDPAGECVGLFKPRGASSCVHAAHLLYAWDGAKFSDVYEKAD